MTIFLDKKRKTFGVDLSFEDFIKLLKSLNIFLNLENNKILSALEDCFKYYCYTEGKINKNTLPKDVVKHIPFIKHHHSSHEGLLERGFDKGFIEKFIRGNSCTCIEYWLKRGFDEKTAKEKISEKQSSIGKLNKGKTKIIDKSYIESLGIDSEKFFKERSIFCVEYWIKRGYSEQEAKKIISEKQSKLAKKNIARGKDELRKSSVRCVEHWLKMGFDEKTAKEKVAEIQRTFTLDKCIKKYGEDKGKEVWLNRQIKWQDSLNKTGFHQLGHSPISQELFKEIEKHYSNDEKDFLFYESKNREYTLKNDNGFYYRYDFCDLNKRKFIEFNGDIYHANPNLYSSEDKPNPFHDKTAKEIWKIDADKKEIANRNGFSEFVVWEKDYRENKEKIINECLNFLKNE